MNDDDLKKQNKTEVEPAAADPAAEETEESAIAKMQSDLEQTRDAALRARADFDNYRKRTARDKEDAIKFANASFLERLIPILDNFELGLAAAKSDAKGSPILAGMEM